MMHEAIKGEAEDPEGCTVQEVVELVDSERRRHEKNAKLSQFLLSLENTFDKIQRFTNGLGVFAQASSSTMLLWGSVRFLLQIFINHIDLLGKLCEIFSNIEEWLGRFQLYHTIFNSSERMRKSLTLMFDDIIQLGRETLQFYRSNSLRGVFRNTLNRKVDDLTRRIHRHKQLVDDDANALAISANVEAQSDAKRQSLQQKRKAIRRWLSPLGHEADYYQDDHQAALERKVDGSCLWVFKTSTFCLWHESPHAILLLNGKPGCGKTVLSSAIIEHLRALHGRVAFFHFKHDDEARNSSLSLVKSLLLQLINFDELPPSLEAIYDRSVHDNAMAPTLAPQLWSVLMREMDPDAQTYIVVDALDECRDVEKCLRNIVQMTMFRNESKDMLSRLKIAIVSRPLEETSTLIQDDHCLSYVIQGEDTDQDIEIYVSEVLQTSPKLKRYPQNVKSDIHRALTERSAGMFLWARLMLKELERQNSQSAIQRCISRLPRGLPEVYDRILANLDPDDEDRPRIFRALLAATRPLTSFELRAMLEVHPDDECYDQSRQIEGPLDEWLFSACGPLVEIQDDRVRFIHATVHDCVRHHADPRFKATQEDGHAELADTCITYLLFERPHALADVSRNPDTDFRVAIREQRDLCLLEYAACNWVSHVVRCGASLSENLFAKFSKFSRSTRCLDWLEAIFQLTANPESHIDQVAAEISVYTSASTGVCENHRIVMEEFVISLLNFVGNWAVLLARDPKQIRTISRHWIPENTPFWSIYQDGDRQRWTPLGDRPEPESCFIQDGREPSMYFFEPSLTRYFSVEHNTGFTTTICFRSGTTGLPLGSALLSGNQHAYLESFSFSRQTQLLACLFRREWADSQDFPLETHLFDLSSLHGQNRSIHPIEWLETSVLESFRLPKRRLESNADFMMFIELFQLSVSFSKDDRSLFTPNGTWNLADGRFKRSLFPHTDFPTIRHSENGESVATINHEGTLEVWHASDRTPIGSARSFGAKMPKIVAVSPTGRYVALWLMEKATRLEPDAVLLRWYKYARLVVYYPEQNHWEILSCDTQIFSHSSVGHFSQDEELLVLAHKIDESSNPHKTSAIEWHMPETSYRSHNIRISTRTMISVYQRQSPSSAKHTWMSAKDLLLIQSASRTIPQPPLFRLSQEGSRIAFLTYLGIYYWDLAENSITAPKNSLVQKEGISNNLISGLAISQDERKILTVLDPVKKDAIWLRKAEDTTVLDGRLISVRAMLEYLMTRKHSYAYRAGLYDAVHDAFLRFDQGKESPASILKRVCTLFKAHPKTLYDLLKSIGEGRFDFSHILANHSDLRELANAIANGGLVHPQRGQHKYQVTARLYDISHGLQLLAGHDEMELSCFPIFTTDTKSSFIPKFSIFADQEMQSLVSPFDIRSFEGHSISQAPIQLHLADQFKQILQVAPQEFRCEGTANETASVANLHAHHINMCNEERINYEHIRIHANGIYLGFVVSEKHANDGNLACFTLCVYDIRQQKVIWLWACALTQLRGFEALDHPIEFVFHPRRSVIAWAMLGMSAAVCDFLHDGPPIFLGVQTCHDSAIDGLRFSPDGRYLATLSGVEMAFSRQAYEYLQSNDHSFKIFKDRQSSGNTASNMSVSSSQRKHLLEIAVFEFEIGSSVITTIATDIECPSIRFDGHILQLSGTSTIRSAIELYEMDMIPKRIWRQQTLAYLPAYLSKSGLASVTRLQNEDQTLRFLIGYWPYPNKWPIPGLSRDALPQPYILEVSPGCCDNWSKLKARTTEYCSKDPISLHGLRVSRPSDSKNGGLEPQLSDPDGKSLYQKKEREKLYHAIHSVKSSHRDLPANISPPALEFMTTPRTFGLPDECQVTHEFPWIAYRLEDHAANNADDDDNVSGSNTAKGLSCKIYASGVSQGYRWESMRTRIQKVMDGNAEPLWAPWWTKYPVGSNHSENTIPAVQGEELYMP